MKILRAIERIAAISRSDWVNVDVADVSKSTVRELEQRLLAETRYEQRDGRRAMLVRLTEAGRAELPPLSDPEPSPAQLPDVMADPPIFPEPVREDREIPIEFHRDEVGALRMGPEPSPGADATRVVAEIVRAIRTGDLDTHPIVVDMHTSRVLADAIWKRWGNR